MTKTINAQRLMESYVERTILTVKGHPDTILRNEDGSVIVGTEDSPDGKPAPIDDLQRAIEKLLADGNYPFRDKSPRSSRKRGSFYFAVLMSLPGVEVKRNATRAVVTDRNALERFLYAKGV
jgi:hypothetical protein